jgi:hypothetical protein
VLHRDSPQRCAHDGGWLGRGGHRCEIHEAAADVVGDAGEVRADEAKLVAATSGSDSGRWSLSAWRLPGRRKKPGGMPQRRPPAWQLGSRTCGGGGRARGGRLPGWWRGGTARRRPVSRGHTEESRGMRGFTRWRGAEQRQKRNFLLVAASRG